MSLAKSISRISGKTIESLTPIPSGSISRVFLVKYADGQKMVAKTGGKANSIFAEGFSLNFLKKNSNLPVPPVSYFDNNLLLMDFIGSNQVLTKSLQIKAADKIADLHRVSNIKFGFEKNTFIGGLLQPNTTSDSWIEFFRDYRLKFMADRACEDGNLPSYVNHKIDKLCKNLGQIICEPTIPSLVHGDLWSGNILCKNSQLSGFIDPAIYFANKEIELAFGTLFSTFDDNFFARYMEHHTLEPGFFKERKDIYNLYPLLVHARLFGGHYISQIAKILEKFD